MVVPVVVIVAVVAPEMGFTINPLAPFTLVTVIAELVHVKVPPVMPIFTLLKVQVAELQKFKLSASPDA